MSGDGHVGFSQGLAWLGYKISRTRRWHILGHKRTAGGVSKGCTVLSLSFPSAVVAVELHELSSSLLCLRLLSFADFFFTPALLCCGLVIPVLLWSCAGCCQQLTSLMQAYAETSLPRKCVLVFIYEKSRQPVALARHQNPRHFLSQGRHGPSCLKRGFDSTLELKQK